jgi:hypothetical protein
MGTRNIAIVVLTAVCVLPPTAAFAQATLSGIVRDTFGNVTLELRKILRT